jgi:hypothetical protein
VLVGVFVEDRKAADPGQIVERTARADVAVVSSLRLSVAHSADALII